MNSMRQTELNRIHSCLLVAIEETGIVLTTGQAVLLASAFQDAMRADLMVLLWQTDIDREAARLEMGMGG